MSWVERVLGVLVGGWEAVADPDSGNIYFYHEGRDETAWELPDPAVEDACIAALEEAGF